MVAISDKTTSDKTMDGTTIEQILNPHTTKPTRAEAELAVKTLLRWAGDNPDREGLIDTPQRVVNAYQEFFAGYQQDPAEVLSTTFTEVAGYDEMVLLKDMRLESFCEHHMAPIIGKVHVAYIPERRVVGISKIARLVDIFAKRLQIQEVMTVQIAETINQVLKPKGVAVVIDAEHHCMSTRGVHKTTSTTITSRMLGLFREQEKTRLEFLSLIKG